MTTKKILIMAAGTGGHIVPALAVAKALQKEQLEIHWLGTTQGLEHTLVPPTGIPMQTITMCGVRGKGIKGYLAVPFRVLRATYQALRIVMRLKPDLVLGFGGFVTTPGGLAAWLLRIPLFLHEQNAIAGMSNRVLSRVATRLFQAFPNTFPEKYHPITCGNPVRPEILALEEPALRFKKKYGEDMENTQLPFHILVVGGSLGAAIFNETLPEIIASIKQICPVEVRHAAGKAAVEETKARYQQVDISAEVTPFIHDMATAYAWADVVICRAGALTVSELAAAGVASILAPYPHAVDDHQTKNGAWLTKAGGALLISQVHFNMQVLHILLSTLAEDRTNCMYMGIAARKVAVHTATEKIVAACTEILH